MFNRYENKAFTLVELIVVIVILAILATIAFLSFSNYSSMTRDSVRMSDLTSVAKGLTVKSAVSNTFPDPDRKVIIYSGSTEIGYEGDAGETLLRVIDSSVDSYMDPLDKVRYTYVTNKLKTRYELVAFLENQNSLSYDYSPFGKANAKEYIGRYPFTKGDQLGVILSKSGSSLTPIQDVYSGGLQVTSVNVLDPNPTLVLVTDNAGSFTGVTPETTAWYTRPLSYTGGIETPIATKKCEDMDATEVGRLNAAFGPSSSGSLSYWCAKTTLFNSNNVVIPQEVFYLKNLTGLDLSSNNTITNIPKEIGNLTNLTNLYLSDNINMTSVPKEIGNLTNLTKLYLGDNINMTSVPKEIGNLTNLIELDIAAGKLTEIPKEIFSLKKLKYLNIASNQITSLPPEIKNLDNSGGPVIYIYAQWNKLTEIPKELSQITNLGRIDLSNNLLTYLPLELGNITSMVQFQLTGNVGLGNLSAQWISGFPNPKKDTKGPAGQCISITHNGTNVVIDTATATCP